ncbi:hypothetical protein IT072_03330 [Leifsonia sp. ZF2019]|uniref:hypothetical protein n=1 Tax=Leifsonia sp. ZF2019 TaxID=2781978 RepID=UPI001CBE4942|nr:hypothetical protein [Leifsonia sp. ZF2019]UAJ80099.1 hypothetical protein IT072_03330 [Leifsonia sp. ZF2019]
MKRSFVGHRSWGACAAAAVLSLLVLSTSAPAIAAEDDRPLALRAVDENQPAAFTFDVDFPIGLAPQDALGKVKEHFAEYFPVAGTPDVFPYRKNLIKQPVIDFALPESKNVTVSSENFASFVTSWDFGVASSGFQLVSAPGNFAGKDSVTAFGFYKSRDGQYLMNVSGRVTNPEIDRTDYLAVTNNLWARFAANLSE